MQRGMKKIGEKITDRSEAFLACRRNGDALMECSAELKDDKELVMVAVTSSVDTLLWASARLREDKDVLLVACSHFGRALRYTDKLRADRDVVLAAVSNDGSSLQMVNNNCGLRDDINIVTIAVMNEPWALQYAGERTRANIDILVKAGKKDRNVLKAASNNAARINAEKILNEQEDDIIIIPGLEMIKNSSSSRSGSVEFSNITNTNTNTHTNTNTNTNTIWEAAPLDKICSPYILDATFIYKSQLDGEVLKKSLSKLLDLYPILCGRKKKKKNKNKNKNQNRRKKLSIDSVGVEFDDDVDGDGDVDVDVVGGGHNDGDAGGDYIEMNNAGVPFEIVDMRDSGKRVDSLLPDEPRGAWSPMALFTDQEINSTSTSTSNHKGTSKGKGRNNGGSILMAVQLTHLIDGCVLGVCASHFCTDGNTFYSILNSWAGININTNIDKYSLSPSMPIPIPIPMPIIDQTLAPNGHGHGSIDINTLKNKTRTRTREDVIKDAINNKWVKSQSDESQILWKECIETGRIAQRFGPIRFSAESLKAIKQAASPPPSSSSSSSSSLHTEEEVKTESSSSLPFVTMNEALCAHLAQTVSILLNSNSNSNSNDSAITNVSALVDLRERLPNLNKNFVGNAVCWTTANVNCNVNRPLHEIAKTIHDSWQPATSRPNTLTGTNTNTNTNTTISNISKLHIENLLHNTCYCNVDFDSIAQEKPTTLYTNSFVKFNIYIDFGYGKPILVIPQHTGDPCLLFPSPPHIAPGGIDVYFQSGLAEQWMDICDDNNIYFKLFQYDCNSKNSNNSNNDDNDDNDNDNNDNNNKQQIKSIKKLIKFRNNSYSYHRHYNLRKKQSNEKFKKVANYITGTVGFFIIVYWLTKPKFGERSRWHGLLKWRWPRWR